MSNNNIYYVYAYLRSEDSDTAKAGTPYYIGKGCYNRAFVKHGRINVPKDRSHIVFLAIDLHEWAALALERRYIKWYGRVDTNTGILHNLTDGGEGTSGSLRVFTEEHKENLRKPKPPRSTSHCTNLSKPVSDLGRANIAAAMDKTHSKTWLVISPENEEFIISNLNRFCKEHNLNQGNMGKIADGTRKHHKGWRCFRA